MPLAPLLVPLAALVLVACGRSVSGSATPTRIGPAPTPTAPLSIFRNFTYPIAGGCLPQSDNLMPNAPRVYRDGIHEGIDFYGTDNCTPITRGTPVVAVKDGVVVRADQDYRPLTAEALQAANDRIAAGGANGQDVRDLFRGQQVWVDQGYGIITRYAHLGGIPSEIQVGARVAQGQTIAFVGDSGTPESLTAPGTEDHLHFELRVGDGYLGQALPAEEVRQIYEKLFQPLAP